MAIDRRSFGKYHVLARLGSGGMGDVYLAVNLGPAGVQKLVVVKRLRDDLAASVSARSMFLDEARIATRLNHPNIVQTNEVVDEGDDLYQLMEFLDGQPLSRLLEDKHAARFSLPMRVRILTEALAGLQYAHDLTDYDGKPLGVVHRDVSPHNIVITYDGHVKLVDFGVAKAADATTITASGVFKGKVRYASPEQALCATVDRRADVFAVGTILWEMLAQKRMWNDQSDAAVLLALASSKIPSARGLGAGVPKELEEICARALASDPADRFPTANDFRTALLEYLRGADAGGDLGEAVAASFGGDRREMRAVIDAQIKAVREASEGALTARKIPIFGVEAIGSESYVGGPRAGVAVESSSVTQPRPRAHSSAWLIAGAVLGIVVVVGGGAWLEAKRAKAPAAPPPAATKVDDRVHFAARANPPTARLFLDGTPLPTNPYESDLPRDDAAHTLSVKADGFESRDVETRFTRDVNVDVALSPAVPSAPSPSPSAAAPKPAVRAPPGVAPARPAKPQRSIDEEDPYKR